LDLQVITEYDDSQLDDVLDVTERLNAHLTAAVVSNDVLFLGKASHLLVMEPCTQNNPLCSNPLAGFPRVGIFFDDF